MNRKDNQQVIDILETTKQKKRDSLAGDLAVAMGAMIVNDSDTWQGSVLYVFGIVAEDFYGESSYPGPHEAEEKAMVEAIAALSNVDPEWITRITRFITLVDIKRNENTKSV